MSEHLITVTFPLPLRRLFTYKVPQAESTFVEPGMRVLASLGKGSAIGFVVGEITESPGQVKYISALLDLEPIIVSDLLPLTRWMAEYYFASWGECLQATLPAGIHARAVRFVKVSNRSKAEHLEPISAEKYKDLLQFLGKRKRAALSLLQKKWKQPGLVALLLQLKKQELIEFEESARPYQTPGLAQKWIRICVSPNKENNIALLKQYLEAIRTKHPKKVRALSDLLAEPEGQRLTEFSDEYGISYQQLQTWSKEGLIEIYSKEKIREPLATLKAQPPFKFPLTDEQTSALKAIRTALTGGKFQPFLLWGVTGSGKTQIYIEAIQAVIEKGKSAIVLVPEVALTSQLTRRFRTAFGNYLTCLHSRLSVGERADAWRLIKRGEKKIILGVRSAVFAPVANLGLIVVDEEHAETYKQSEPVPRYQARDVAVMRAKLNNAVIVLGSATPSLESYYNACTGKYTLLRLTRRIFEQPLPRVKIIDLKTEPPGGGFWGARFMVMKKTLQENQQVMLFLNRRGFAGLLKCRDCGLSLICPNCSLSFTYHKTDQSLRCHFCNHRQAAPKVCPRCQGPHFLYLSAGTQRIESDLSGLFSGVRFERMDLDTTRHKDAHWKILDRFAQREVQILLGTQMITKGLDFPEVGLVGVVSADVSLNLPDFRARERTFQLLTQVAGRTGRGDKPGAVLIQTYHPDDPVIQLAAQHNYEHFADLELKERKQLSYPPFERLISVLFRSYSDKIAQQRILEFSAMMQETVQRYPGLLVIVGPAPAPFVRLRKEYRWRVLLKTKRVIPTLKIIENTLEQTPHLRPSRTLRITVDVDPQDLL